MSNPSASTNSIVANLVDMEEVCVNNQELLHKKSNFNDQDIKFKLVLSAFEPWCTCSNHSISWEAGTWTLGRAISGQVHNQLR